MKLVILDRDGVVNEDSDDYIKSPEEWIPIPGSLEAIARLNHVGCKVVIASNQSGLSRGLFRIDELNAIHQKMRRMLDQVGGQVDGIFFCPHLPRDNCQCRKPRTGLLTDIRQRFAISLSGVPLVGDSLKDIQVAIAVGAEPILVQTGKGRDTLKMHEKGLSNILVVADLADAADYIIDKHFRETST